MRTVALSCAVLACGAGVASAQGREPFRPAEGITVYDNADFDGQSATFRSDVPDLRAYRLNDRISSLRVARGEFWEVCEDTAYRGRCVVVSGAERDLRDRGWNDTISSLRRVRGPGRDERGGMGDRDRGGFMPPPPQGELALFEELGYRGRMQKIAGAVPALDAFGSQAKSVQILDGVWELCDGPRWSGRCVRVEGSVPDLGRVGLGGIVSARPVGPAR
jgi:hypothetical protein